jgi:hypothetical protein
MFPSSGDAEQGKVSPLLESQGSRRALSKCSKILEAFRIPPPPSHQMTETDTVSRNIVFGKPENKRQTIFKIITMFIDLVKVWR